MHSAGSDVDGISHHGGYEQENQIPIYVSNNKEKSKHHVACVQQIGGVFEYIPLTDLKLYQGPPVYWEKKFPI